MAVDPPLVVFSALLTLGVLGYQDFDTASWCVIGKAAKRMWHFWHGEL